MNLGRIKFSKETSTGPDLSRRDKIVRRVATTACALSAGIAILGAYDLMNDAYQSSQQNKTIEDVYDMPSVAGPDTSEPFTFTPPDGDNSESYVSSATEPEPFDHALRDISMMIGGGMGTAGWARVRGKMASAPHGPTTYTYNGPDTIYVDAQRLDPETIIQGELA